MKKLLALLLALVMALSLASCGDNGGSKETLSAENAISETPKHIEEDCEANLAKAKQNIYLMKCVVGEISDTDFECGWGIHVCLPTEELAKLTTGDEIAVIGKITEQKNDDYIMGEAELYDGEVPEPKVRESDIIEGKLGQYNGVWEVGIYDEFYGYVLHDIYLADKNDESKFRNDAFIKFTGDFVSTSEDGEDGYYENVKIISVEE